MVKHAQDCCLEGNQKLKSYRSADGNVVLFFNCVDRLVGATFGDHYIASDMFHPDHQVHVPITTYCVSIVVVLIIFFFDGNEYLCLIAGFGG